MKVNYKVIETDDNGTRVLVEKRGFGVTGDDFEAIKAKFNSDMKAIFGEVTGYATREWFIEPAS